MEALERCLKGKHEDVPVGMMPMECLPGALFYCPTAGCVPLHAPAVASTLSSVQHRRLGRSERSYSNLFHKPACTRP